MLRLIAKIDDSIINKFAKQRKTDSRKINFLKFISNISNGGFIWLLLAAVLVLIPDTREYGLAILIGSLIYFFVGLLFIKKTTRRKRPYEKNRRLVLYTSKPKTSSFPS
ncbi:TPA: PAP2 family protein, partial [Enterococcus faecium]